MQDRTHKKRTKPFVAADQFLQSATTGDFDTILQYLSENEGNTAAINARNPEGETAAMLAAKVGHTEIVIELLTAGCKVDRRIQIADEAMSDGDEETARILTAYQKRTIFIKKLIDEHQLSLSREQIRHILTISEKRYLMLADKSAFLADYVMLDNASFQAELEFALRKFPRMEMVEVTVIKNLQPPRNQYKVSAVDSFFIDRRPKQYTGHYGIVNEGYAKVDDLKPTYGVKWFRRHHTNPSIQDRDVRREAKYNHHFTTRHHTLWFVENGLPGLRYQWQKGDLLNAVTNSEILRLTPLNRVKCLLPLFEEVNYLHSFERQHGDLGFMNVVLNKEHLQLRFIDLGKGKKIGRLYDDSQNYSRDMNDLWKIVKKMFPELKKKHKSIYVEAMHMLAQALFHKNSTYVCTSAQAFDFCQAIVAVPDCTNKSPRWAAAIAEIKLIADRTINSSELTIPNLRRGSVRAATFK